MTIDTLSFYFPWPNYGVKLSDQWDAIRSDTTSTGALIRQVYADIDPSANNNHTLAGLAFGKLDAAKKFRVFYDQDNLQFKIQFNSGNDTTQTWVDVATIRESDNRFSVVSTGGLESTAFYNLSLVANQFYMYVRGSTIQRKDFPNKEAGLVFDSSVFYLAGLSNSNEVLITTTTGFGEANTASSAGGDTSVFKQKTGVDLELRGITAGTNISLSQGTNDITISAADSSFYPLTIGETDDSPSLKNIQNLKFEQSNFYVTQQDTDTAIINFRGSSAEANTASNLGSGEGLFSQKSGVDLQFKSIRPDSNFTTVASSTELAINTAANFYVRHDLEVGNEIKANSIFLQDKIVADGFYKNSGGELLSGFTVTDTNDVPSFSEINKLAFEEAFFYITQNVDTKEAIINLRGSTSGEANTASNRAGDEGIFHAKTGVDLSFKSLTAGNDISLSSSDDAITITSIAASALGSGFYQVIFRESQAGGRAEADDTLVVDSTYFYMTTSGSASKPLLSAHTPPLRVSELDGAPNVNNVRHLVFPNGSVTDNADGSTSIAFTGSTITFAESESGGFSEAASTLKLDSGYFYISSGGDGNPLISLNDMSGGDPLRTYTPSGDTSIIIDGILSSSASNYKILFNFLPTSDGDTLAMRTSSSNGVIDLGASDYSWTLDAYGGVNGQQTTAARSSDLADTEIQIAPGNTFQGVGNVSGSEGISGMIQINHIGDANQFPTFSWHVSFFGTDGNYRANNGGGTRLEAAELDTIEIFFLSGTIASGSLKVYVS